jgi:amino acid transporter
MGVGAMVGAGIFALLGEAAAVAGSAVYISFLAGGIIALASAYSLGKLGARYPAAGGIVEYLVQAFGVGVFSGGMSVVLYVGAIVSLALVAEAFGSYASVLIFGEAVRLQVDVLAVGIVAFFCLVNLRGPGDVALFENVIVATKLAALAAFMLAGLYYAEPALLRPSSYAPAGRIVASVGITFFAYEGFRVITNTAEDMRAPERTLLRAMLASVAVVMCVYVLLSLAVFGNLPVADAMQARDYALAEAARPVFGQAGFTIVVVTALISTATAINAGLFAATNVTYQLAKDGELPQGFQRTIAHSREGLLVSAGIIVLLVLSFDLAQIAVIGSITVLLVHGATHLGHLWKLRGETGARLPLLWFAVLSTFAAAGVIVAFQVRQSPLVVLYVAGFFSASFLSEWLLRRFRDRRIQTRVPE